MLTLFTWPRSCLSAVAIVKSSRSRCPLWEEVTVRSPHLKLCSTSWEGGGTFKHRLFKFEHAHGPQSGPGGCASLSCILYYCVLCMCYIVCMSCCAYMRMCVYCMYACDACVLLYACMCCMCCVVCKGVLLCICVCVMCMCWAVCYLHTCMLCCMCVVCRCALCCVYRVVCVLYVVGRCVLCACVVSCELFVMLCVCCM